MDRTVDLVAEAEKIVGRYADERSSVKPEKKDAEFDLLLNAVMALSCVTLAVVLALGLL